MIETDTFLKPELVEYLPGLVGEEDTPLRGQTLCEPQVDTHAFFLVFRYCHAVGNESGRDDAPVTEQEVNPTSRQSALHSADRRVFRLIFRDVVGRRARKANGFQILHHREILGQSVIAHRINTVTKGNVIGAWRGRTSRLA